MSTVDVLLYNMFKKDPALEEKIIEHMREIYKIAHEKGTKCYLSMCVMDTGGDQGVYYHVNNEYYADYETSPLDISAYVKEPYRNMPDSENVKSWNKERGNK